MTKLYNKYLKKLSKFQGKLPVTDTCFCSKVRGISEPCQTSKTEIFVKMVNFVLIF